ncbi:MAG TPA: hypothetical protein VG096_27245 [Bryobacteraceae bacterium]|jgi:hypothetical protein|nr:hypothetical protein [Bryobacteraceae bacterium]
MNIQRDWIAIAKLYGVPASGRELDRVVRGLQAVDDVFRPLAEALPPSQMPAVSFRATPEGEE